MTLFPKCFSLTAISILAMPLWVIAGDAPMYQAPVPAVIEARIPAGGTRLELGRIASLKRQTFAVRGDLASDSSQAAATLEVSLGTTLAVEEYNELRQSVALLADGTYASVWTERIGNSLDVVMQWVRRDGSKVFPGDGRYVADSPTNEFNTVVTSNPAGGAFVAFSRYHPDADQLQVYVQSYNAAGNPRWASSGVFATTMETAGDYQDQIQLIAAPKGGVYVCMEVFHSHIDDLSDISDIVCQRLDAKGRRLWPEAGVRAGGLHGWKVLPKLVRDDRNGVMVFWRNNRDAFTAPDDRALIEGQHLTPEGTRAWGRSGKILRTSNLGASGFSGFAELSAVSDGQGGAIISFNDWRGQGALALDVFSQRVTGDGRLLWGQGAAVATGDEQQQNDSIIAAPDGGAFVTVWQPLRLWLYRLGPEGKVRWKRQISSSNSGSTPNDWGAYGSFDKGRLRIAWIHQQQNGTWTMDVYLAIFDQDGRRLNGPAATPITSALDGQFLRGFAFDSARLQGFAAWEDRRKGTWDDLDTIGGLYKE